MSGGMKRLPSHIIEFDNSVRKMSKAEIAQRKDLEIKLGDESIKLPESVADDPVALAKWEYLAALYQDFKFVTSADVDVFEQYCLCYSEVRHLQKARAEIVAKHERFDIGAHTSMKVLKDLAIDTNLKGKRELLLKIGSLIFLDPTSRVKAIPLPKKEEPPKSKLSKFGIG